MFMPAFLRRDGCFCLCICIRCFKNTTSIVTEAFRASGFSISFESHFFQSDNLHLKAFTEIEENVVNNVDI